MTNVSEVIKWVLDKIENNIPEPELKNLKRKLDVEDICVAKKMKLDKENKESNWWLFEFRQV